jgi:1-aminocyclopropane-1-carboxylate deaminase/D-cysteine desulfhydrase-like pyridoxal-dependent ACC family enzyme
MVPQSEIPLVERFPALRELPRARFGQFPSPVERMEMLAPGLWFKREDLDAEPLGGNKVRALEFLLGSVRSDDLVVTVGAAGSTHALATLIFARRLGAHVRCFRWRQEMNDAARRVADRIAAESGESRVHRTVAAAYARALLARLGGAHWIPAGGSSPLGVLGQVNAALETAKQVSDGLLPPPQRIVVPLGTGGTVAGLALGLAIAGIETEITAVRVVPRVVANGARVRRLISRTARLLERLTSSSVPRPGARAVRIVHDFYGGAYGRETSAGRAASKRSLERTGVAIDPTYGAKALAAAMRIAQDRGGTTLFWLTFDGRWLRRDFGATPADIVALG